MFDLGFILTSLGFIVPVTLVIITIIQGCAEAPPNHAYIISGLRKQPRVLIGRAGIKIPPFKQLGKLCLGQIMVDIRTNEYTPTSDFINVMVDAVAKIRVADGDERMKLATRNLLDKEPTNIAAGLQDSLQGNVREIIGTLTLGAINTDHDSFSGQAMAKASKDIEELGTDILSCNIQSVTNEHGFIQGLDIDSTSKIREDTSIAKTETERGIVIVQAAVDNAASNARVAVETGIVQKNNELVIEKAELQRASGTKKAEVNTTYEIQKQEQQKTIQTAMANAQIARAEHEAELRKQEILVQQQALEAEVNKKADVDRYVIEQAVTAGLTKRQREAEAKKYEQEQKVPARKAQADTEQYEYEKGAGTQKAIAETQKYSTVREAGGIRAKGEAEATVIRARALVETEGMEKKAEAYQKYNKATMAEMMIQVLPDVAGKITEPLSQIDKITVTGGDSDSDNGVGAIAGNVPMAMAGLFESMKEIIGVDLAEIMEADAYDAEANRNMNLTGAPDIILGGGQKVLHPSPDLDSIQP